MNGSPSVTCTRRSGMILPIVTEELRMLHYTDHPAVRVDRFADCSACDAT